MEISISKKSKTSSKDNENETISTTILIKITGKVLKFDRGKIENLLKDLIQEHGNIS
jgi:hypothetical protein